MMLKLLFTTAIVSTFLTNPVLADVVVNNVTLTSETETALESVYGEIPDGKYWYDPVSGLWGIEGGPSVGKILPGLVLGGPLQANASGGGDGNLTGTFLNGREIHPQEYQLLLSMYGYVLPGRFWLAANLVGGYENGPALFDLKAQARAGGSGYNQNTAFGGLMSDGQCSGYLHPGGTTVMTGNC